MDAVAIPLGGNKGRGMFALVDSRDFTMPIEHRFADGCSVSIVVSEKNWHPHFKKRTTYATARISVGGKKRTVRLHRLLLGAPPHLEVDHRDGDGLNNVRSNLRLATSQQNQCNQRKQARSVSRFKGVTWHSRAGKWMAQIKAFGKRSYLGIFVDEEEAARAYDRAAIEHFGEFARLNFPDENRSLAKA